MRTRIIRLGKSPLDLDLRTGSTVGMALEQANIPTANVYVSVNGLEAHLDRQLNEGDNITLVPPVAGGAA